ncbi:DUF1254 domain-containing protein [Pseudomonas sp. 5P_3.1_Bac2]|uniref:DUF1254 domain-containing protein n=1 Tax=Pseudomonas sp. 5P_3.1_Bac2 TaxID=2971617 RepID=UPI0021C707DF|nr:DUF1254 domain-containing protein [Pseudomonas sp. 5P_3.1_Bac2]MCU1717069.1 DUF1254 domain-containing protein [Pseudomonas sp. 5P_3.1_Bac2]
MKKLIWAMACWGGLAAPVLAATTISKEDAQELARDAYIYAYPLVLMQVTRETATNVLEPRGLTAPVNQLAHARAFPDHNFTVVVRPNADTLYSAITYDVSKEPLVVELPDSQGRYYLMPLLDYWTDVFSVPGTRTTGNQAQRFAIVSQDWQGTLPEGVREYRTPTKSGLMIGRIQTNGKADYAAVHAFQDGMRVYPLSAYGKDYTAPKGVIREHQDMTAPPLQVKAMSGEQFFNKFAALLKDNPPHNNDYPMVDRLKRLGIEPGQAFDFSQASPEVQAAMRDAPAAALGLIEQSFKQSGVFVNGWRTNLTAIGTYGADYLRRAGVAYAGLGANPIEDAIYPSAFNDSEGKPLQSDQRYVLHFKKLELPPARAFWSLAMYDERQLFTDNPIGRYSIGDRDELKYNADGSLDIYIQRQSPGAEREANWLPTPASGGFSMNLRLYWPHTSALTGGWTPPQVKRIP